MVLVDVDQDDTEEIVIGFISYLYNEIVVAILDYNGTDLSLMAVETHSVDFSLASGSHVEITATDFDYDNNTEIVLALKYLYYFRYNYTSNNITYINRLTIEGDLFEFSGDITLLAEDADMDFRTDLLVAIQEYSWVSLYMIRLGSSNTISYRKISMETAVTGADIFSNFCVGDFDNDNYKEIALAYSISTICELNIFDDVSHNFSFCGSMIKEVISTVKPLCYPISVNGDILVKYTGIHNVSMSQPYIIAVMAAPPTVKAVFKFSNI